MIKDNIRDYATDAFRYWASIGCPTYEEAVSRIVKKAELESAGQSEEVRSAFVAARLEKYRGELGDIKACNECFEYMKAHGKECVCSAVREVYMVFPRKRPARGELSGRVLRFAINNYYSEIQVYRFLREACEVFAEKHHLRFGNEEI